MALLSPGLVQGLATGFGGDTLLTDLAQRKLQLKAGTEALKTQEEQTSANKIWSRAIMDVLAGSGQSPVAPPIAPQPGQVSVPMTQGTAGAPATPSAPGLGGAPPAPTGAPSPTLSMLGGTATAPSPTLSMLGGTATAPSPPPATVAGPLDVSTILQKIQAQNKDLDPGVLSSIVNDHILPLLSQQQQNAYQNWQHWMEYDKLALAERDKADTLIFKYMQLDELMKSKELALQEKTMLSEGMQALRQSSVDLKMAQMQQQQPLIDSEIAKNKAEAAASLAEAQKRQDAVATGGPKFQQTRADIQSLKTMVSDAYAQIKREPSIVGLPGDVKGIGQTIAGTVRTLTGQTPTGQGSSVSQFHQTITTLQDRVSKLLMRGNISSQRAARLNEEIQGLTASDTADTALASMSKLYHDLADLEVNLAGNSGAALKPGQVVNGYIYQGGDPNSEASWKSQ